MSDNNNEILVSAVIPAYNAQACVGRAIDSVLGQTLAVHEIIVVDDGSSDKTCEVVERYGDKVILIRQENAGVSVARNKGIETATGNWIAFLDADDEWLPEKNLKQIAILKQNPDLKWCAANSQKSFKNTSSIVGDQRIIAKEINDHNYFDNYFTIQIKGKCPTHTPTMIIRKDIFDEVGGFEPGRKRSQDLDLWWRIALYHPKIGYVAEPQVTVHLEAHDNRLVGYRVMEKRGCDIREIVARHLPKSKELGVDNTFKPFAKAILKRRLRTMLFNGFGKDARETVHEFKELFSWWIRCGVYILTVFPHATSMGMRSISWLKHALKINRQVTRKFSKALVEKHTD